MEKKTKTFKKSDISNIIEAAKFHESAPKKAKNFFLVLQTLLCMASKENVATIKIVSIATILNIHPSTVTHNIRKLEKRNFIKNLNDIGVDNQWRINIERINDLLKKYRDAKKYLEKMTIN